MSKKVLVVAAHPDDEILGVGGTVLRHAAAGDIVHTLIMAEGLTSRDEQRDVKLHEQELAALHERSWQVAKLLGVKRIRLCCFPDNRMDGLDLLDVVKEVEYEVQEVRPEIVYTHHAGDINIDHQLTSAAVLTACRPLPGQSVREIYFFETLSSTEWQLPTAEKIFKPNLYVDISSCWEQKIEALHSYESEMREYPHPRSYKAVRILAEHRGFEVGCDYAEAFEVGRIIRNGF